MPHFLSVSGVLAAVGVLHPTKAVGATIAMEFLEMSKRKLERLQEPKILGNKEILFHKGNKPLLEEYVRISIIVYDELNNGRSISYFLSPKHYERLKDLDVTAIEEYVIKYASLIQCKSYPLPNKSTP